MCLHSIIIVIITFFQVGTSLAIANKNQLTNIKTLQIEGKALDPFSDYMELPFL